MNFVVSLKFNKKNALLVEIVLKCFGREIARMDDLLIELVMELNVRGKRERPKKK